MARFRRAPYLPAFAALLGVLLLAPSSPARDDDVDFVMALVDRGYDDLAKAEIDRLPRGEPSDYARCLMLRRVALSGAGNDRAPPQEVRAKFDEARSAFDAFLKAYPAAKSRAQAEFSMGNLMNAFAYYLTKSLEKFEVKDRPGVQEEAGKIFDSAIQYFAGIKEREQAKDEPLPIDNPERFAKRNEAWYYLCVAMHDRAMLKPPGDAVRLQQFTQAIEETKAFFEETEGTFVGVFASDRVGLAYWHRGQMQKGWSADDIKLAREYFASSLTAMDVPNIEQEDPGLVDVMFQSAVNYGKMCNEVGMLDGVNYPKLFHDEAVKMTEKLPSAKSRANGLQLLIEDARAMSAVGNPEGAIALLSRVSEAANGSPGWGPGVDFLSKKALNEILASIPSDSTIQIAPPVLFKAGDGSLREGQYGRAIRAYQRVLVAVETEPDPTRKRALTEQFFFDCWANINEAYTRQERFLEAFYAADYPVQRFLSSGEKTPSPDLVKIALYRITALQNLVKAASKEQKADLTDQMKRAQELYTTRFQPFGEGPGDNVTYTVALQKLGAGNTLVNAGDGARAAAVLQEAVDLFGKVDPKDSLYAIAQAHIGECLVLMGKPEEGIKHLQALIQKNQAEWNSPSTPARQKQPWGWAVFWIASANDGLKRPAKVVEALEGFEGRFQGANLDPTFSKVRFMRIGALVAVGRGEDAVRECDQLMKDSPDSRQAIWSAALTANDLKVRSDKAEKDGNRKAALELKKRSLPYYDFWVSRAAEVTADNYTFVGSLHFEAGSLGPAAEMWTKALDTFKKEGNEKMADTLTINLAGLLVGQGRYAEALPQFETLFIKVPEVEELRAIFESLKRKPGNVPAPVWDKKVKDILDRMADVLSKDPDGAARAGEAKKVAGGADSELLVRAYADTPELRRALARAAALCVLGSDAALPPDLKSSALQLVKRRPDLMSNIARCYEELATANPENAIRAVNIYATLIESSRDSDDPEHPSPKEKYSEEWFDWKYHWVKVYVATGTTYKERGEAWLRTACDIVKAMSNVGEVARANKERPNLGKEFETLRDQADSALRGIGKDGCK